MVVLHLISSEGVWGAESMLGLLGHNLRRYGCQPIIGTFSDPRHPHLELAEQAEAEGLETEIIPCKGRLDWHAVRHVRKVLCGRRVDVLHAHGYKTNLYAYVAARHTRTAVVSTCHAWQGQHLLRMRMYAALDRLVLRLFDRVVAVSDDLAETLKLSGVESTRVKTIPNGIELERFRDARPLLRKEFPAACRLIGMVGRLAPEKGGDVLLRAVPAVLAEFPDTFFVFVGDGPCRQAWASLAKQLGAERNVAFSGTRRDMPEVYASLDALVLPSFNEGLPMCVLEAMAACRPVIATPVGSVDKLVLPGRTGLMVKQGDVTGLTAAILCLLREPGFARKLGEHAQAHVADSFSADLMTRRYLDLYYEARQLCGNRS
jgi:glycosyltransferase involved in cell wall biosynthesis